ncbi:MAG: hypothetical protein WA177_21030 [Xanthobacteraceae bacterium]|jgi:hypothetical protein
MSSPIRRLEDDDADDAPSWLSVRRHIAEPPQAPDIANRQFSGDRAMVELNRQLSLSPDRVPEPPLSAYGRNSQNLRPLVGRFFLVAGVAAIIAGCIVFLPSLRKTATETTRSDGAQTSSEAKQVEPVEEQRTAGLPAAAENPGPAAASAQPRVVATIPISGPAPTADPSRPAAVKPAGASITTPRTNSVAVPTPNSSPPAVDLASSVSTFAPAAASAAPLSGSNPSAASGQPHAATAVASLTPVPSANLQSSSAMDSSASRPDTGEMAMLVSRGKDFLSAGDLSGAQLLFRRAAEAGSAEAALALASTYDPHYLAAHNVVGVIGDQAKARAWYQRAMELGSTEAAHMLAQLGH